jgi:Aminoglycoside-2''-adenylyltransferase
MATAHEPDVLSPETADYYRSVIKTLNRSGIPYLIGGAYAFAYYTGIARHTKDIDIFVRAEDAESTLGALATAGCETEMTFPHWLGKAFRGDDFCDVIFSSGNGVARVDDLWFTHAVSAHVFGESVRLIPAEEMIWSKGYILERERFDGADICHVLLARGDRLDWERLLMRFDGHWRVLLSHLVLFGFVYPGEHTEVPNWVMEELLHRVTEEVASPEPNERLCQGTLLSREQYLKDIREWGYRDVRLAEGTMSKRAVRHWTAAAMNGPK